MKYMLILLLITGCSALDTYKGIPVDAYSTQEELKDVMRDAGLPIPNRPVYGFVRLVDGQWRIQVWENNPKGYWCVVEHEEKHIVDNQFVAWHEGPSDSC